MSHHEPITLARDCKAVAIPSGVSFMIEKGTQVFIVQSLGGSHTVTSHYGLARVDIEDQDALGFEPVSTMPSADQAVDSSCEIEEAQVWEKLKTVYDPEIPVDIVDLGLVYSMQLDRLEEGGYKVDVKMTLTAPGCGMGPTIQADARSKVLSIAGVRQAEVELVWEPAWNQDMITESGKMKLGMI